MSPFVHVLVPQDMEVGKGRAQLAFAQESGQLAPGGQHAKLEVHEAETPGSARGRGELFGAEGFLSFASTE